EQHHPPLFIGQRRQRCVHLAVQGPPRHARFLGRGALLAPPLLRRACLAPPFGLPPPPPAPPQGIQRPVACDGQNPGRQRPAPRLVPVDPTPHLREHVAYHFLCFILVLQDSEGEAQHPRREQIVQLA